MGRFLAGSVCLSQCHHNCVMTKHPDAPARRRGIKMRYWSYERPELISAWFALGQKPSKMELGVIQHHRWILHPRLDEHLFLRPELVENQALIEKAEVVELQAGDVLLFHCRLLHAAGRNESDTVKLSTVFTYHRQDNRPKAGTRSDRFPSIEIVADRNEKNCL